MTDLLTGEDAVREECKRHTITVTPVVSARGLDHTEPVEFYIDCSCDGLHMGGDVGGVLKLIQGHLRGHGVPVSRWWPQPHPGHPRYGGERD